MEMVIQQNSHDFGYCQSQACRVKRPHTNTKLQDFLLPVMGGGSVSTGQETCMASTAGLTYLPPSLVLCDS